jgi:hypothetical protein
MRLVGHQERQAAAPDFLPPEPFNPRLAIGRDAEHGLQLLDDQGRPLINTAWWLVMAGDAPPSFTPLQRGILRAGSAPVIRDAGSSSA